MKLTENTKVRIKVPKHMYEAIQAELDKNQGMEEAISGKAEELKDFYEKVKEQVDGGTDLDSAISFVMNDLGMEMMEEAKEPSFEIIEKMLDGLLTKYGNTLQSKMDILSVLKDRVQKKIKDIHAQAGAEKGQVGMEEGYEEKVEEDVTRGAEIVAKDMMGAISSGDPFMTGVALVGAVVAGVIAGPKVVDTIKGYYKALTQKDPAKADKLAAAAEKAGLDVDGVKEGGYETEMEEALDMETLMEAVKDIAKKKADAKKKEAEAKKKKEAEDKKKADEKKKKEAEAKKKAVEAKKK